MLLSLQSMMRVNIHVVFVRNKRSKIRVIMKTFRRVFYSDPSQWGGTRKNYVLPSIRQGAVLASRFMPRNIELTIVLFQFNAQPIAAWRVLTKITENKRFTSWPLCGASYQQEQRTSHFMYVQYLTNTDVSRSLNREHRPYIRQTSEF